MLEHSSAHHTSAAGGNKGPPFASHPRTIRRSPEGTRVPPLLRILAPSVGRRREQGSPLCFNCYDPQPPTMAVSWTRCPQNGQNLQKCVSFEKRARPAWGVFDTGKPGGTSP